MCYRNIYKYIILVVNTIIIYTKHDNHIRLMIVAKLNDVMLGGETKR